jgi:hypothetical protein
VRKGKSSVSSLQIVEGPKAVPTKYLCSDPIGVLKAGSQTVRHHTLGWLKADLIANGTLDDMKEALHAKIWADYNAQKIYIRAQQDIMGKILIPCTPSLDGTYRIIHAGTGVTRANA